MDEEPLFAEDVDVQRVAINQVVESVPDTRIEGDTTIIPVVEEILVVEKRLVLREEVRITKRRNRVPRAQPIPVEQFRTNYGNRASMM